MADRGDLVGLLLSPAESFKVAGLVLLVECGCCTVRCNATIGCELFCPAGQQVRGKTCPREGAAGQCPGCYPSSVDIFAIWAKSASQSGNRAYNGGMMPYGIIQQYSQDRLNCRNELG